MRFNGDFFSELSLRKNFNPAFDPSRNKPLLLERFNIDCFPIFEKLLKHGKVDSVHRNAKTCIGKSSCRDLFVERHLSSLLPKAVLIAASALISLVSSSARLSSLGSDSTSDTLYFLFRTVCIG